MNTDTEQIKEVLQRARSEVSKVIIGQDAVVDKALIAIFTGHHALIEGVPGVAKTLLVRTLARVLGCEFNRIQFTPDLMPADITGTSVFNMQKNEFTLIQGPVFTTFLLADEINRAPAKTQSALLQAMQERRVTIDRETHALSPNFTVFATQNPIEYEGTYPLPEAQKDRFMLKTLVPVMSAGMRSGVNWMRLNSHPSTRARVRTSSVFATPGTPSMSAWWPVKMAISALSITSSWPMMTLRTSARARVRMSVIGVVSVGMGIGLLGVKSNERVILSAVPGGRRWAGTESKDPGGPMTCSA